MVYNAPTYVRIVEYVLNVTLWFLKYNTLIIFEFLAFYNWHARRNVSKLRGTRKRESHFRANLSLKILSFCAFLFGGTFGILKCKLNMMIQKAERGGIFGGTSSDFEAFYPFSLLLAPKLHSRIQVHSSSV